MHNFFVEFPLPNPPRQGEGIVFKIRLCLLMFLWVAVSMNTSFAEPEDAGKSSIEINGDRIEAFVAEDKIVAEGNVSIVKSDVTLLCDKVEFYRTTKMAFAEGHVVLKRKEGEFTGDRLAFNFGTMAGDFTDTKVYAKPFYGAGKKMSKVGENHLRMESGYLTTCDLDKPHFRFGARKVDIYPGDKFVARNVRLIVGDVPLIYMPRFTQDLRDKKPVFTFTPGYDKNWGAFLLTAYKFHLNNDVGGTLHLDYRERKDVAEGLDLNYKTEKYGEGLIRTYYMNERPLAKGQHFWEPRLVPTPEHERFRAEWRHKWDVDDKTNAIWQYYKLSDKNFLKDYFLRESDRDQTPPSYVVITRRLPHGILGFRVDDRINHFVDSIDRLPQISYNFSNTKIGDSGFYWKSDSLYSNLVNRLASPSDFKQKAMRFDQDQEISHPLKLSIFEFKPFVGGRQTYYSRIPPYKDRTDVVRGIYRTGADISTKFYKIYDITTNAWGLNIHRLRHVITPTIAYDYVHDPTIPPSELPQFDEIDAFTRAHTINFSIENKLQTKRNLTSVDLARLVLGSDFFLKENPGKGGFQNVTSDLEMKPYKWLAFYSDSSYNTIQERLTSANFDIYLNPVSKWSLAVGKRYNVDVDDQITTELNYTINQKWKFRAYERFDISGEGAKEHEYGIVRDLHCWTMEMNFNETRGQGSEIWIVFHLKDFPEVGFDFGQGFNKRKSGSQTTDNSASTGSNP